MLTRVYGSSNPLLKSLFWDTLEEIGKACAGPWCISCDFNAILEQKENLEADLLPLAVYADSEG